MLIFAGVDTAETQNQDLQHFVTLPKRVLGAIALMIPAGYVMQPVVAGDDEYEDQVIYVFIRRAA